MFHPVFEPVASGVKQLIFHCPFSISQFSFGLSYCGQFNGKCLLRTAPNG
jgi:hypothetical protein